jgi:glycosyltransferase involved in cell wall biosynthesis
MRKVFVLAPGENWIVDRFVNEWNKDNPEISTSNWHFADVIWIMPDWCWSRVPLGLLKTKKVIVTVHHIVPNKFGQQQRLEFAARDLITDAYHVPNKHTEAFIQPLTQKPIHVIPYWANNKIWRPTGTKKELREKHGFPVDGYLVGSFQRDTEGSDLISPKLEKGPDLLCNWFDTIQNSAVHVILAGWRRQYVIERLQKRGIAFSYFEKPSQDVINDLYQTLDLYPVTARYEGGPQSLIEAGLLGIPVVSRDVGMASQVLSSIAINDDISLATPQIPNVEHLKLPAGYEPYRKLIEEV